MEEGKGRVCRSSFSAGAQSSSSARRSLCAHPGHGHRNTGGRNETRLSGEVWISNERTNGWRNTNAKRYWKTFYAPKLFDNWTRISIPRTALASVAVGTLLLYRDPRGSLRPGRNAPPRPTPPAWRHARLQPRAFLLFLVTRIGEKDFSCFIYFSLFIFYCLFIFIFIFLCIFFIRRSFHALSGMDDSRGSEDLSTLVVELFPLASIKLNGIYRSFCAVTANAFLRTLRDDYKLYTQELFVFRRETGNYAGFVYGYGKMTRVRWPRQCAPLTEIVSWCFRIHGKMGTKDVCSQTAAIIASSISRKFLMNGK